MTLWSLRPCAAIIMIIGFSVVSAHAAEIRCASIYGEKRLPEFPGGTRIPEDIAQRLWPSGVRPTSDTCKVAFIHGDIVKGDYERFIALYKNNHPFLDQFYLDSRGGDVDEAIKIGRLFRKYLITAVAPYQMVVGGRFSFQIQMNYRTGKTEPCFEECRSLCASSCALIWFGAPDRAGDIGLHRPRTDDPAFKALSAAEAATAYRRMLDESVRYLEEMETPRPMIDAMVSTGSAEIRWIRQIDHMKADDSVNLAPSFAEWVDASCGQFTSQETDTMMKLQAKKDTDELLLKLLYEKYSKKDVCRMELISSHRDRLPLP
jgi:hypothetical protein